MSTIDITATGISPAFIVSAEEFKLMLRQGITRVTIDGVEPPTLGDNAGYSHAMDYINQWYPWIDEKIVEPKYDGICQYLGVCSNQPSIIKDYHMLAMNRAVDYLLAPTYVGSILAKVDTVMPKSPPKPTLGS